MFEREAVPTSYYSKSQMKYKKYDIFYNLDYNLSEIKRNQHKYYEIYFLLSGSVSYFVENRKYSLESDDLILIPPNQEHNALINNEDDIPYERYVLWLDPSYLDSLSSERTNFSSIFLFYHLNNNKIEIPKELYPRIKYLFRSIYINSMSDRYGSDILGDAYITELLVYLAQISLFSSNSIINYERSDLLSKEFSIILEVLTYIESNIYESISIEDICNHVYTSRSYLSRIFSEELGISVYQYIIKKKLFLSRQDIVDGLSLDKVCEKYSFGNYSSFYRAFHKEFGLSPQSFRQESSRLS